MNELPLLYKGVHLSAQEIADKLVIVRKAIREFSKMKFSNSIQAREELNKLIGIY